METSNQSFQGICIPRMINVELLTISHHTASTMGNITDGAIVTISIIDLIVGVTLNVGIILANYENLKTGRNGIEIIYFSMGLANTCMQATMTVQNIINVSFPFLFNRKEVYSALFTLVSAMTSYNFWLLAWLCVHYCVVISNITHPAMAWLRGLLCSSLRNSFLMSAGLLLSVSVLSLYGFYEMIVQCAANCTVRSSSEAIRALSTTYKMTFICVNDFLPFCLASVSIGITGSSLIKHMWNIKQKLSGSSPPNLQVLVNATRTMVLFLSLSVGFYISQLILISVPSQGNTHALLLLCWLLVMFFPTVESAIIIQASPKIKREFLGRFCVWRARKTMTTS